MLMRPHVLACGRVVSQVYARGKVTFVLVFSVRFLASACGRLLQRILHRFLHRLSEVVLRHLQVVLGRYRLRVPDPRAHDVQRISAAIFIRFKPLIFLKAPQTAPDTAARPATFAYAGRSRAGPTPSVLSAVH